ncbi:MAG: glycine cleavage system aminomethyltransferase GcvT, partial [Alphaproteobacteria bacterium]
HTRAHAGLFDVSHMGQARILPARAGEDPAVALERLMPGDIQGLKPGRQRYSMLLNDEGGIIDDLMIARQDAPDGRLFLVVNAATKEKDFALLAERLGEAIRIERLDDRALVALQGPEAVQVLSVIIPGVEALSFMQAGAFDWQGASLWVSRSGYTGEDGFEISLPADRAEAFFRRLLDDARVRPVGLGARDSLRLEAGLCLYGHDIDETTDPVEADLAFAISKRRREAGDFPGSERILKALREGPSRRRVGLRLEGRAIAREGAEIMDESGENEIGRVTSGTFSPTLQRPIAMGYVKTALADAGRALRVAVRRRLEPAEVVALPFVPHRYARRSK